MTEDEAWVFLERSVTRDILEAFLNDDVSMSPEDIEVIKAMATVVLPMAVGFAGADGGGN